MIDDKFKVKDEICFCENCSTFFVCDTRKILPDFDGSEIYRLKPCSKGCEERLREADNIRQVAYYRIYGGEWK